METLTHKYTVEPLSLTYLSWFVEEAAVSMLLDELNRPELINYDQLYLLAQKTLEEGTTLIAKKGDTPVGAISGFIVPNLFNPLYKNLVETIWYVDPAHRTSRAGIMLLDAFKELGEALADETIISLLPSSDVNTRTLEKRGFMLAEYAFRRMKGS